MSCSTAKIAEEGFDGALPDELMSEMKKLEMDDPMLKKPAKDMKVTDTQIDVLRTLLLFIVPATAGLLFGEWHSFVKS